MRAKSQERRAESREPDYSTWPPAWRADQLRLLRRQLQDANERFWQESRRLQNACMAGHDSLIEAFAAAATDADQRIIQLEGRIARLVELAARDTLSGRKPRPTASPAATANA